MTFEQLLLAAVEPKEKLLRLAGAQLQMELHCADRRPAVRDGTGAAPGGDSLRQGGGAVESMHSREKMWEKSAESCRAARWQTG